MLIVADMVVVYDIRKLVNILFVDFGAGLLEF